MDMAKNCLKGLLSPKQLSLNLKNDKGVSEGALNRSQKGYFIEFCFRVILSNKVSDMNTLVDSL